MEGIVSVTDFSSVFEVLTGQLSVSTIITVLAMGAGVAVGLAFMWWGIRKLTSMLMNGIKKGKVSI